MTVPNNYVSAQQTKTNIHFFALVMLMIGAVDSIRNIPSIAIFGQQLIFFVIAGAIFFLLPTGLISAELCTHFKEDSGIYRWSTTAFGHNLGALAIWLQWLNAVVWFPTSLAALTGTFAYLVFPQFAHNPSYLVIASLSIYWALTFLNLRGIRQSSRMAALGTTLGIMIPMSIIIVLSFLWIATGKPEAIHLTHKALMPALSHTGTWMSLTAVIMAFSGMELATVHVRRIRHAHVIFPKALIVSIIIILLTMGLSSLGVAIVIPHQDIVLVTGTVQALSRLFTGFHMPWLTEVVTALMLFGSLAAIINWMISPVNGLVQAAQDGYLPKFFAHENKHGTPDRLLILQAVIVSIVIGAFFVMPSINGSYWLLLDMSIELYVMMYILMFCAALKHLMTARKINLIPGGKCGAFLIVLFGLIGSITTFIVGFFPPQSIDVGTPEHYVVIFTTGLVAVIAPVILLMLYKKFRRIQNVPSSLVF